GAAERAGLRAGDVVVRVGERAVRAPRDAIAALAVLPEEAAEAAVTALRDGAEITVRLPLDRGASAAEPADAPAPSATPAPGPRAAPDGAAPARDCPHPAPVCAARASVFPVSSFDPLASATRIGPDLLVTNRHVVADRARVLVQTPDGPREGRVVPSAYRGDLALIEAAGLPADGPALALDGAAPETGARVFAVGADATRRMVRVFAPGAVLAQPAPGAPLGRLHVSARMQPGVSGGALVGADGALVGVAVGGGEGRFEAIPLADLRALLTLRDAPEASRTQAELGGAFARCAAALAEGGPEALARLSEACAAADNAGQLLEAGRALAAAGDIDGAAALHAAAAAQTPNGLNARLSLLTSLQLGGRFPEMLEHARRAMAAAPRDPRALRFSFDAVTRNTVADAAQLDIIDVDGRAWCMACEGEVAVTQRFDACPNCGSHQLQVIGGDDLRVKDLEVQ
ncbi:MAG: hydrogenase/urease maturation nickel metallochaperone HypA, partial [Pseudomonadota bacterium]